MTKLEKRIRRIFNSPRDCTLHELLPIVDHYGYRLARIKGSHHVFKKTNSRPFVAPVHNGEIKKAYLLEFIQLVKQLTIPYEIF